MRKDSEGDTSVKITKKGNVIAFQCGGCDCEFVVGKKVVREYDGNYYCNCPMCGAECYTNVARQGSLEKEERK